MLEADYERDIPYLWLSRRGQIRMVLMQDSALPDQRWTVNKPAEAGVEIILWSVFSPGLNFLESVWNRMEENVRVACTELSGEDCATVARLREIVQSTRDSNTSQQFGITLESMYGEYQGRLLEIEGLIQF